MNFCKIFLILAFEKKIKSVMKTSAIVRKPGKNFFDGLTKANLGKPIFEIALKQHLPYCQALRNCGLVLTILEADEKFPDGCFVEDTAIVTDEIAIITTSGNKARQGEEVVIQKNLEKYKKTIKLSDGLVDGGDIMRVENHFYIGLSDRTNTEGADCLSAILAKYNYTSFTVKIGELLHLKTGIAYIGNNNIITVESLSEKFISLNKIVLNSQENYSANCLFTNGKLLIAKGFQKIVSEIVELGYDIVELEMTEFQKMNGGLTCLSSVF